MINCKFFFFAAGGEPSSERYFMDKPLLTEACSDVSDAEIIMITCGLYRYHNNFEGFAQAVGYILKLFCVVLPVGYCEVMFLCMSFLQSRPRPSPSHISMAQLFVACRKLGGAWERDLSSLAEPDSSVIIFVANALQNKAVS